MTASLATFAYRAILACILALAVYGVTSRATDGLAAMQECQEDMACWDCETMGNQICGRP